MVSFLSWPYQIQSDYDCDCMLMISVVFFFSLFLCLTQAIDGTYIDNKCPFTGNVRIRGRILTGIVQKLKMQRTIVIRRDYLHYVRKYSRFEKRHKNMSVHLSPAFRYANITISSLNILEYDYGMMVIFVVFSMMFF